MLSNATRADTKRKLLTKDVLAAVAAVAADAAAAPLAAVADADPSAAAAAEICDICFPACGVVAAAARNSKEDPPKDVPPSQPGQPQAFPYRALASRRCASSAAQYHPPGVSPLGGDAAHARPHRAQTEGCLLAEDGGLFSVTAFAFLGAPRRRTARLEPGAGCWTHSASHTGHTHVCMVVSFRRYTSAPSRVSHENGSSGAARSAAHRKLSCASTQRSAGSSSGRRALTAAARRSRSARGTHRSAFMPRYARAGSGSASGSRGAAVREEGGGRRKHSVRSFARARAGRTSSSADDTIARIRAPAHRARRAGGRMVTCASECATPRAPRRATPRVKLGRPPRGVFRAL